MNNLFSKLNILVFGAALLFSQVGFSQETPLEQYQHQVGNLVFSLENVQNEKVIQEIARMDSLAGGALSVEVASEIAEMTFTAIELMKLIVMDDKLPQEAREKLIVDLGGPLGALVSTIIRQHGDDALNPEKSTVPPIVEYGKKVLVEAWNTAADFFMFPKTRNGDSVYKLKERMIREYVSQELVIKLQKQIVDIRNDEGIQSRELKGWFFDLVVPDAKKESPTDLGTAEKALRVRTNRLNAHRTVVGMIGMTALIWAASGVDFIGAVTGGTTFGSIAVTEVITYGALGTVFLLRQAQASFGTIAGLKNLIGMIKNPEATPVFSTLKMPLMARLLRIQKKVEAARAKLVPGGKVESSPQLTIMDRVKTIIPNIQERLASFRGKSSGGAGICRGLLAN